ncbi:MAG TPA: type IV pilus biogenesis/stability protein PilW [Steroidobacteraceae bacterium]|nr:type IV pilus biogenesis/stability protein PilW [Steroidobacteraceae bacterium]
MNSTAPSRTTLRLTLVALAALALAACATNVRQGRKDHDAAAYNTQLGVEYMRQGDLQRAKDKLDRAVSEDPQSPSAHAARAMLFERMGERGKADAEFHTSLRLAPHDPQVINSYAVYLCSSGRTDEGVKAFLEAAHNPLYRTPEAAYANAGVCQRTAKHDDEAAANFNRALQLRPDYAEAAFQLASLQFEHGQLPAARSQIDGFLGSHEATADLLLLGVRVARAQGDRGAAQGFARRLQRDFAGSDQARALAALDHNPG